MIDSARLALFLMLGQSAEKGVAALPEVVPPHSLRLDRTYELALLMPEAVKKASDAAEAYRLFFVFEEYLRELIVSVLAKANPENWWDAVPKDVQDQVQQLSDREELKTWMALGQRDRGSLMTLPQLLKVIEDKWKDGFEEILRDRSLVNQAKIMVHLRNTICHMTNIPHEELERVRQIMRDWFRMVAP